MTLERDIDAATTPLALSSALDVGSLPAPFMLDDEAILVTGGDLTALVSVNRGQFGTAPAAHTAGTALVSGWDFGSYGELTVSGNVEPDTLTNEDQWYQVTNGWIPDQNRNVTLDAEDGTMTPTVAGQYITLVTLSFVSEDTQAIEFGIFRNGILIPDHVVITWVSTEVYPNAATITGIDTLAAGDVVDLRMRCTTTSGLVLTVTDINYSIAKIGRA